MRSPTFLSEPPLGVSTTDDQGRYEFVEVPFGRYFVSVDAQGYVCEGMWFEGPGRRVSIASGENKEGVNIDLVLGGVISGRIIDADGNPVTNEPVDLFKEIASFRPSHPFRFDAGQYKTDGRGRFSISGVLPGHYFIGVGEDIDRLTGARIDKNDNSVTRGRVRRDQYFVQTFYPGVTDWTAAQVIEVASGQEKRDLNMSIGRPFRAYSVSGRVLNETTGEPVRQCYLQLGYNGQGNPLICQPDTDENGNFKISGLISGKFSIRPYLPSGVDLLGSPIEFEIHDADVSNLEVKVHTGLTLSGQVVIEADNSQGAAERLPGLKMMCAINGDWIGAMVQDAQVDPAGKFTITALGAGKASLSMGFNCDSCDYFSLLRVEYPKSKEAPGEMRVIRANNAGGRPTASFEMADSDLPGVRVILAYHNGAVRAHLNVRGNRPVDGLFYLLVSRDNETTNIEFDADGNAFIDGLKPGEYELFVRNERDQEDLSNTRRIVKVQQSKETSVSFDINLGSDR